MNLPSLIRKQQEYWVKIVLQNTPKYIQKFDLLWKIPECLDEANPLLKIFNTQNESFPN